MAGCLINHLTSDTLWIEINQPSDGKRLHYRLAIILAALSRIAHLRTDTRRDAVENWKIQ
jgi:hypothetical protein